MILYLILNTFYFIINALVSLIPVFETPVWVVSQLPDVLHRIASFNYYLPVYETVGVVLFLINFVLTYKIFKVILNTLHVDLNS